MGFAAFVLFGIAVAGISMVFAVVRSRAIKAAWMQAAAQLNLDFDPGTGSMSNPAIGGMLESFPVLVDVVTTGSGDNRKRVTRYRVTYPPFGLNLHLTRQIPFFTQFMGMFGAQDIETGDAHFDELVMVQGSEEAVRAFLNPVRRNTISRLFTNFPGIEINDSQIELKERRLTVDSQEIVSRVRRLAAAARQIAGSVAANEPVNTMLERRERGDLDDLVVDLETEASTPDLKLAQAEIASVLGERARAREIVDELAFDLPSDPEVLGWQDRLSEDAATMATASPQAPSLEADDVAHDLFGGQDMSFEIDRKFADVYRDRDVRWQGEVKHESHYAGGVRLENRMRVTVNVATLESNLYGTRDFDAVVEVDAVMSERLQRGAAIEIEGRMASLDALMRNVFLENATLREL